MNLVKGFVDLARLVTTLSGFVGTMVAGFVVTSGDPDWIRLWLAAVAVACVQSSGNTINDVYDLAIDRINKPNRPIPRGAVSPYQAEIFAVIMGICGVVIAFFVGAMTGIIATVVLIVLWVYAKRLKKTFIVKNLVVAALSAGAVLFGSVAMGVFDILTIVMMSVAFLGILGREVLKDMADVQGDVLANVETIPIVWGLQKAKMVFALCMVATVMVLVWSVILLNSAAYTILTIVISLVLLGVSCRVRGKYDPAKFEKLSTYLKAGFFVWFLGLFIASL